MDFERMIGEIVEHETYGIGTITGIKKTSGTYAIDVQFESEERTIPFTFPDIFVKYKKMKTQSQIVNTAIDAIAGKYVCSLCGTRCKSKDVVFIDKKPFCKACAKKKTEKVVSFIQPGVTLYVGKGIIHCRRENHQLESVTGVLRSLRSGTIKINVNYCHTEDIYFIPFSDYVTYRNEYGILLGNFNLQRCTTLRDYDGPRYTGAESILHEYGYNVDKNNGLTAADRQLILKNLMVVCKMKLNI